MTAPTRIATGTLLLLPGALLVYLSFNAGGFFPGTTAFAALVLTIALALRIALADAPFAGFSWPLAIATGALALYALWTLLSGRWSHAPGRALLEFDRALLYLLALVLFGSLMRTSSQVRWMLRGIALAIVVVCVTGLATRVLPDLFPTAATIADNRLSYPLTYWNSLGLLASIGIVLCFHLACSRSEPPLARVLGSAAVPLLASALLFTFSRGAIAAGIIGLVIYMVVARPRALISGLLATVPTAAIAVAFPYNADLLATLEPTTSAAADQGHGVAVAVLLCVVAAAGLRTLLLKLDDRLPRVRVPDRARLPVLIAAIVVVLGISIAVNAPGQIGRQYDRFTERTGPGEVGDLRTRITDPANNGRIDHWDVALDAWRRDKLAGNGAGTYQNLWATDRAIPASVRDGHSLYFEVLGELGLIGFALLATALLTILVMLALRTRGAHRTLYAALFAAAVVWAFRAGVDWDWEMPAVTLWLFAIGGATLAASEKRARFVAPLHPAIRVAAVAACFGLAIVPSLTLISQTRLDASADAYADDNCAKAIDEARSSISALGVRPEPYEIMGFCELQEGSTRSGLQHFEKAVDLDPDNWQYRHGLALAQGVAGLDPRPSAQAALRLNPLDPEAQTLAQRLRTTKRSEWRRQARALLDGASPFYLSD